MLILGYSLAIMMGLILGMIGAGGSILTVPILVYLLGVKPVVATGYSLLVVGSAALTGAIAYWRHDQVYLRATFLFAIPAMLAVLATRTYIIPNIPENLAGVPKDSFIMMLFAILMMLAAIFMLRPLNVENNNRYQNFNIIHFTKLIAGSAGVGLLTGMVGAGGGFLIIPTLIALFGLSIKEAIGTSLAVIAINSLVGFRGDMATGISFDWPLLLLFITLTLLGMAIGTSLGNKLKGEKLKIIFGILILFVGILILVQEIALLVKS